MYSRPDNTRWPATTGTKSSQPPQNGQVIISFPEPSLQGQQLSHKNLDKELPPSPPRSAAVESFEQAQLLLQHQLQQQQQRQKNPLASPQSPDRDQHIAEQESAELGNTQEKPSTMLEFVNLPAPYSGHIRVLQLKRPAVANAISYALLSALRKEIQTIQAQYSQFTGAEMPWTEDVVQGPTRALIIASSLDECFSAGADLKELITLNAQQTSAFFSTMRDTFKALASLPIPTISAVGSVALGSGFELALATSFRVFASNASVALPETGLGIIPAAGGTHRLAALVGSARAREIVMTSRTVPAKEAYALGIASRLVDLEAELAGLDEAAALAVSRRRVLVESIRLAEEICEGAPVAVRAAIQAFEKNSEETEKAMCERTFASEDWKEALRAFEEKRKPVFKGR